MVSFQFQIRDRQIVIDDPFPEISLRVHKEEEVPMRTPRLKLAGRPAVYHCISRTTGGEFLLDQEAKERFRKIMWSAAAFCGVELLTYSILSNHFHLLVRVPVATELTDEELYERARQYFGQSSVYTQAIDQDLKTSRKISAQLRSRLTRRMGDLSIYLKEVK